MRLAKEIYWLYLEKFGVANIGNILIPVDGVYMNLTDVPNSYVEEIFGFGKEDLYNMIMSEVDSTELKESLDDL